MLLLVMPLLLVAYCYNIIAWNLQRQCSALLVTMQVPISRVGLRARHGVKNHQLPKYRFKGIEKRKPNHKQCCSLHLSLANSF